MTAARLLAPALALVAALLPGAVPVPAAADTGGPTPLSVHIDRLSRATLPRHGRLVVTDYKTGRVPNQAHEQSRLGGVHFYALLCQEVLGERPARVQLLYLAEPIVISTAPSEQSIRGTKSRAGAVWAAVERACRLEDFRPKPSGLCTYCAYQRFCPAFGGDPTAARAELVLQGAAQLTLDPAG